MKSVSACCLRSLRRLRTIWQRIWRPFFMLRAMLHGGTPVAKRTEIVDAFQGEAYVPFIVLSVKAAGTGLNLTKANHVIHFDRWWNPAVENQATDRAFRIGQKKDVIVHTVSQGTIEEKIDAMLESKKELAENRKRLRKVDYGVK